MIHFPSRESGGGPNFGIIAGPPSRVICEPQNFRDLNRRGVSRVEPMPGSGPQVRILTIGTDRNANKAPIWIRTAKDGRRGSRGVNFPVKPSRSAARGERFRSHSVCPIRFRPFILLHDLFGRSFWSTFLVDELFGPRIFSTQPLHPSIR